MHIRGIIQLEVVIKGQMIKHPFKVIEEMEKSVLLGNDFLKKIGAVIDMEREVLTFGEETTVSLQIRKIKSMQAATVVKEEIIPARCGKRIWIATEHNVPLCYVDQTVSDRIESKIELTKGVGKMMDKRMEVYVINRSEGPICLWKGLKIGRAIEMDEERVHKVDEEMLSMEEPKSTEDRAELYQTIDGMKWNHPAMTPEFAEKLKNLLREYIDIFATNAKKPPITRKVKHKIDTGNSQPIKQRQYRLSEKEKEIVEKEVKEMKKNEIIRPSKSPWAAPVVLVEKKDGSIRFCIDYRKLNQVTKKDVYPLPRIDETIDTMGQMEVYSTMDLASGYWQIEIEEEDKEKTAFICHLGLFEFNIMPFGLCNAPSTFQRMMDEVLEGTDWSVGKDYIDDIIVGSKSMERHLEDLKNVFQKLREAKLTAKLSKCKFAEQELLYLGHMISKDTIKPNPSKVAIVKNMQPPTDVAGLRRFLGMTSYYRRFIEGFAKIAYPLHQLLRKGKIYKWSADCQNAFETLKSKLTTEPVIIYPDFTQPMILETDASLKGLGAILGQERDGKMRVIAYASRGLSKAEKNYAATELECLAMVWAVGYFRPYLHGRKFKVVTDHNPLKWLMEVRTQNQRLARWALKMQGFDMEVEYRAGRKHKDVDMLSRLDISESNTDNVTMLIYQDEKHEKMKQLQEMDEYCNQIKEALVKGDPQINQEFNQQDGLLYRKDKLVVPKTMQAEIISNNHNSITAGHLGRKRTYQKIQQRYYWPRMYMDVKEWTTLCIDCNMFKRGNAKAKIETHAITTSQPFEIVAMDFIGPLPTSSEGNRHILVITDHFTKWVEAWAVKSANATTVAQLLMEFITRHGAPQHILSDRGTPFMNEMIEEVQKMLDINRIQVSAYRPQTHGIVERFNKTLVGMMSMYVSTHQKEWAELLPYMLFAYRTSVHESTNKTPFAMIYGREARLPTDFVTRQPGEQISEEEYAKRLTEKLIRIHEEAKYYNDKVRQKIESKNKEVEPQYHEGQLVWLYAPLKLKKKGQNIKLKAKWHGPYEIIEIVRSNLVRLRTTTGKIFEELHHIERIKPFKGYPRPTEKLLESTSTQEIDQREWEVERIIGSKGKRYDREYLVKWRGYKEPTWEPKDNLDNSQAAVYDYEKLPDKIKCNRCDNFDTLERDLLKTHQSKECLSE